MKTLKKWYRDLIMKIFYTKDYKEALVAHAIYHANKEYKEGYESCIKPYDLEHAYRMYDNLIYDFEPTSFDKGRRDRLKGEIRRMEELEEKLKACRLGNYR